MKKTTTKKAAAKKATAKKTAVKKTAAKKVPAKKAAVKKTAVKKTVAAAASKPPASSMKAPTKVVAHIDVGFGNTLYIRGDGPGLDWNKGVMMECISDDSWEWSTYEASSPFAFKVTINDESWASGENHQATIGKVNTIEPVFE